jgi:FkbM family methyltransferase
MRPNLNLIGASLCRNPQLASRIQVNWFGLGVKTQQCKMMAPRENVGDGFTRCADMQAEIPLQPDEWNFVERGTFDIHRLDQYLVNHQVAKVDMVKIDVEGFEYQVFASAPNFLANYRPRLVKSEVWSTMTGTGGIPASGLNYLGLFEKVGYKFFKDTKCQIPTDAKYDLTAKGVIDTYMCIPR